MADVLMPKTPRCGMGWTANGRPGNPPFLTRIFGGGLRYGHGSAIEREVGLTVVRELGERLSPGPHQILIHWIADAFFSGF
jgi:hypothetical protein